MKKLNLFYVIALVAIVFASCKKDEVVVTKVLNLESKLTQAETQWIGDKSGVETGGTYLNKFDDGFFVFDNYYTPTWNGWGGFMYTNKSDVGTAGPTNNSAITGKGYKGKVYLTVNTNGFNPAVVTFKGNKAYQVSEMYVTNSTYAYLSMKNGDSFAKKFADGDWFKLEIYGKDLNDNDTQAVELYLADFRSGKTEMLETWKKVDLKPLGVVKSIHFNLSSTDNGEYGMNTPSYFCVDGITAILE